MSQPPPLPPRKVTPSVLPSHEAELEPSQNGESVPLQPPLAAPLPPPLPPRTISNRVNVPAPIHVVQQETTPIEVDIVQQPPPSSVTVAVTPATPPDSSSPISPNVSSLDGNIHQLRGDGGTGSTNQETAVSGVSVQHAAVTETVEATRDEPTSAPLPKSAPPAVNLLSSTFPTPPPLPPRRSRTTARQLTGDIPSTYWILYASFLVFMVLARVSPFWFVIGVCGGLALVTGVDVSFSARIGGDGQYPEEQREATSEEKAAVNWVNHALYALFPLISTDVLTPFVDLLEDALAEQVPPIVTSVRLNSPSLGSQPVLLTSLRPLTDQEWFASLTPPNQRSRDATQKASTGSSRSPGKRSSLIFSPSKNSPTPKMSRSISASSIGSGRESDNFVREAESRRKRDKILQKVSRGRNVPHSEDGDHTPQHQGEGAVKRDGNDNLGDANLSDGDRKHGGFGATDMDEEDPNAGQYVNFQVGFEYKRNEDAKLKGRGLHCLAYFGVGVKGIAKSEVPVYIDVLSIKGTVNLRLLLSATPPFVRTGTFSLPSLPEYDISAKPLTRGAFNAMDIPGMKTFVKASIKEVAEAFVRPKSYTLDLDRLLLGQEASLRTSHVGVLRILIHRAEELPKADAMGSCDPYVSISFSQYHKPLFSTRTIGRTRNPVWEEEAFVLISGDAIEAGERLRLRVCDSDRFSADDDVGIVEVDLADLVDTTSDRLHRRHDELKADRPGMRSSGTLDWSVQFCPVWQMSPEESAAKIAKTREHRETECEPKDQSTPFWMSWLTKIIDGQDEQWVKNRSDKRKETMAWFTGEKERDVLEADTKPREDLPSGILQFHIHQCNDLETEPISGTYSGGVSTRSAAGGSPALSKLVDRTPTENPDPPSAYCEVVLNDKLVYRTRTKQVTPLPYFNAVSERFVRDWTKGRVVFVVRDERNREHDPILGLVNLSLKEVFAARSQITRWFPLVGGLGWGRVRISLLWKPLDMRLPRGILGYDISTLQLRSFSVSSIDFLRGSDKGFSVVLRTDSDKYELAAANSIDLEASTPDTPSSRYDQDRLVSPSKTRDRASSSASARSQAQDQPAMDWDVSSGKVRLGIMYRHSCSLLISFVGKKSGIMKKRKVLGMGVVRLNDLHDGENTTRVGVWGTTDVAAAFKAEHASRSGAPSFDDNARPGNLSRTNSKRSSNRLSSSSSLRSITPPAILLGYVNVSFVLHPGVSKTHRRLAKRDLRFGKVYEAWEAGREVQNGMDRMGLREEVTAELRGENDMDSEDDDDDDFDDDDDSSDSDDDEKGGLENKEGQTKGEARMRRRRAESVGTTWTGLDGGLDDDEDDKSMSERRKHTHALHKRHRGIFQLKIARTGRYVKDKIGAKIHSAANSGGGSDGRPRGTDWEVEREGTSKI
ncbi:hypothetical protein CI109_103986 [Kwoniella shandongensis]|uniref:Uncharacterized protein n=1 Tax=Kwoniella shandongensis TaxID=1734106 RepID=A0A5M6BZC7_9TREE|nr:uncharacterized protein CI109_004129 [Kwoniella shandongensis]KAA5527590.1 hypothetical protein CI109_004129 [Kwoniella shandongensis]